MFAKLNDPISSISHLVGAVLSIPVTLYLIFLGIHYSNPWYIVSFAIFGASLFALYTASTVYHLTPKDTIAKLRTRKVDHMMIFVLIAGTYTPVCLISLRGAWGYSIVSIIWAIAISGIIMKIFVLSDSKIVRYISTSMYLLMGWLIIIAIYPLAKRVDSITLILLALGGVSYTIGAVIYALKKPNLNIEWLSFHDIFHFFVLIGSAFHVLMMFTII